MFGILNLNKPAGWTSRDVVNRVARLVKPVKAGHAGTLDPLATGVLVVCLGPATRLVPFLHEHSKSYEATFLLGRSSPTDDVEGEVREVPLPEMLSRADLERLLPEFKGEIEQVPPAFSAVKINGERAYRAARRGEAVEVPPRQVRVQRIDLTGFDPPEFSLSIECGTGTYIRSIGRDLARRLGTEAVMAHLVRTSVGPFTLPDSVDVEALDRDRITEALQSPLAALTRLRQVRIEEDQVRRLRQGQSADLPVAGLSPSDRRPVAVIDPGGELAALAVEKNERLAPTMVFPPP